MKTSMVGLLCLFTVAVAPPVSADDDGDHGLLVTHDSAGLLASASSGNFDPGPTNGFFTDLGTNGRTCNTCHVKENAWTITPAHVRSLPRRDPLFTPNDGSDCPPTSPSQGPDKRLSTELLSRALVRVQLGIPVSANFSLVSATNPGACAIAPGSVDANDQLFLFRRPLPSTNLVFHTVIMWDGRETLHPITTQQNFQSTDPLVFDLADQANSATTGHAQGGSIVGTQAQSDIVAFETEVYTAQALIQPGPHSSRPVFLAGDDVHGGPRYITDALAPGFFVGQNDPLMPGFTNANFDLFTAWEPTGRRSRRLGDTERAIGRGEALFNNTTFVIHDVSGLNSAPSNPLYNPNDPLAGQDIIGGCAICHNTPNIGNHSTALPINIGVTMAQPVNNDGSPNNVLDLTGLPVYTLHQAGTGATVQVTDPGRALVTGKWTDVGKTKGPMLRGLAAREPYFHNGSAQDLTAVVNFYNARFNIGLTADQVSDMVAFLNAL